jgi:hypothetical protein
MLARLDRGRGHPTCWVCRGGRLEGRKLALRARALLGSRARGPAVPSLQGVGSQIGLFSSLTGHRVPGFDLVSAYAEVGGRGRGWREGWDSDPTCQGPSVSF